MGQVERGRMVIGKLQMRWPKKPCEGSRFAGAEFGVAGMARAPYWHRQATQTLKPSLIATGFLCLALASGNAPATDCQQAVTTPELNQCAKIEQQKVEAKLNMVYQQVLRTLNEPDTESDKFSEMKQKLIQAQRAWVKFRELDCDAVYSFHAGGTIRTLMFIDCMQEHATQRIKDLEDTYGSK